MSQPIGSRTPDTGNVIVRYTDSEASWNVGFETVSQQHAIAFVSALATQAQKTTPVVVSQAVVADNTHNTNQTNGGDNMDKRIAILEVEVAYIKKDVSEVKDSVSKIDSTVASLDKNMALVLEKLNTIKESVDKKPSTESVDKKISDSRLAILLGVPAIIAIGTAAIKLAYHFLSN